MLSNVLSAKADHTAKLRVYMGGDSWRLGILGDRIKADHLNPIKD